MTIPVTKNVIDAIQLLIVNWSVPLIPCPLVHPPAHREPRPSNAPPIKATPTLTQATNPKVSAQSKATHCSHQ